MPAYMTLLDHAKALDPSGKTAKVVETLDQNNSLHRLLPFKSSNGKFCERTTLRSSLPKVTHRNYNQPSPISKSTKVQQDEGFAMLNAWSECDFHLANQVGATQYRADEAEAFLESMSQECSRNLFYGNNSLNPQEINGLATRYANKNDSIYGRNVIDFGGTGADNTSIWLLGLGEKRVCGIYPMGSKAGLEHINHGMQTIGGTGIGGERMTVYQDEFNWNYGLSIKDWRYAVGIRNIDVSELQADTSSARKKIIEKMILATKLPPNLTGKFTWVMNRTTEAYLDLASYANVMDGGGLKYENVDGKKVMSFRGFNVMIDDAILDTEAAV